jgi:hypothetical protein
MSAIVVPAKKGERVHRDAVLSFGSEDRAAYALTAILPTNSATPADTREGCPLLVIVNVRRQRLTSMGS